MNRILHRLLKSGILVLGITVQVACTKVDTPQNGINKLTFSIDGGAPISVSGPVINGPVLSRPTQMLAIAEPIGFPRRGKPTATGVYIYIPPETGNIERSFKFAIRDAVSSTTDFTNDDEYSSLWTIPRNERYTLADFMLVDSKTSRVTGKQSLKLSLDASTSVYHGNFDLTYCELNAAQASTCDIPENQHHIVGTFDIQRNEKSFQIPFEGSRSVPIDLGTTPVYTVRPWNSDNVAGYYSVNLEPGKNYIVATYSDGFNTPTVGVPFDLYADADHTKPLCSPAVRAKYADYCQFTPSAATVYMVVNAPTVDKNEHVLIRIVEDISNFPEIETKNLSSLPPIIEGKIHVWQEVFRIPVNNNLEYTFQFKQDVFRPDQPFVSYGVEIFDGDVNIDPGTSSCIDFEDGLPCSKLYGTSWSGDSRVGCNDYHFVNGKCTFHPRNNLLVVVIQADLHYGAYNYKLVSSANAPTHQNQGSQASPMALNAQSFPNFTGEIETGPNYYQVNVERGKLYDISLNTDGLVFSALKTKSLQSYPQCSMVRRCFVLATENSLLITVDFGVFSKVFGQIFQLSMTPVQKPFEPQHLQLASTPLTEYQGMHETGFGAPSTFEFDTVPNTHYAIHLRSIEPLDTQLIHFEVLEGTIFGPGLCKSTFVTKTRLMCTFQSNSVQQHAVIKADSSILEIYNLPPTIPILGTSFDLGISSGNSIPVFKSEGSESQPISLTPNARYHGQVNNLVGESYYQFQVKEDQAYELRITPERGEMNWNFYALAPSIEYLSGQTVLGTYGIEYPYHSVYLTKLTTSIGQNTVTIVTNPAGGQGSSYILELVEIPR